MTFRVLVADDQTPFRRAVRSVLGATADFELLGEATSGEEALALVERTCGAAAYLHSPTSRATCSASSCMYGPTRPPHSVPPLDGHSRMREDSHEAPSSRRPSREAKEVWESAGREPE